MLFRPLHRPLAGLILLWAATAAAQQLNIDRVELMPNIPQPYDMTDWHARALAFDAYVFDFDATGQYLPLIWWDESRINAERDNFALPSYVGSNVQHPGTTGHEGITCMGAVLGATVAGIDKSDQDGQNWVIQEECYYNVASGENLVLNTVFTDTGGTFWYELAPHLFFYSLVHYYPGVGQMEDIMLNTANKWWLAGYQMGGATGTPDFDWTAFDFDTLVPVYNGLWREPDASAAMAWIGYMAYRKFGQNNHLELAEWGMQFLTDRPQSQNPSYELMLPYGAYLSARMNAEMGYSYDTHKILNWCFNPSDSRPGWGVVAETVNGYDFHGLFGSIPSGYCFAMNTFNAAGQLVPLVRYDDRYARAIGKWMLNAANNARLFYQDGLPDNLQSDPDWDADPDNVMAYEGLRRVALKAVTDKEDYGTPVGTRVEGDVGDTLVKDNTFQVLEEVATGGHDALEHIWRLHLLDGSPHSLRMYARVDDAGDADSGFDFEWATSPTGPWTHLFTVNTAANTLYYHGITGPPDSDIYLRATDNNRTGGNTSLDRLEVDRITLTADVDSLSPYGQGDDQDGRANTGFGVYGSVQVGMFGGIIRRTNNDHILQLDCIRSDVFRAQAYPTYLYYNPHGSFAWVNVEVGAAPVNMYDAVANRFLATNVTGEQTFRVEADSAVLLVLPPAGGTLAFNGNTFLVNGVVTDYSGDPTMPTSVRNWEAFD